jgi:hypothetical protein
MVVEAFGGTSEAKLRKQLRKGNTCFVLTLSGEPVLLSKEDLPAEPDDRFSEEWPDVQAAFDKAMAKAGERQSRNGVHA